jgi:hypothetical protein
MLVFVDPFDAFVEDGSSNFGFLKSPSDKRGSFMQRCTKNEIDLNGFVRSVLIIDTQTQKETIHGLVSLSIMIKKIYRNKLKVLQ